MQTVTSLLLVILLVSVICILFAVYLAKWILKHPIRHPGLKKVCDSICSGASGFLKVQYTRIAIASVIFAVFVFIVYLFKPPSDNDPSDVSNNVFAWTNMAAFLFGAACSALSGYIAMFIAVRTNGVAASAAVKSDIAAIVVCLRGGAFSGTLVTALSLIGVSSMFAIVYWLVNVDSITQVPSMIVSYGLGASWVALFAQVGGGIYTKAADVGADISGKLVQGLPEDDIRNPAVVADLVGDNVGDCVARGADLFESTAAENIGAMILASSMCTSSSQFLEDSDLTVKFIMFPLILRAFGAISSIIGTMIVRTKEWDTQLGETIPADTESGEQDSLLPVDRETTDKDPMSFLNKGFAVTFVCCLISVWIASFWLLNVPNTPAWWHFALCGTLGLLTALAFVAVTQYFTDCGYKPVKSIVNACETGHGTAVISMTSMGMMSTVIPTILIGVVLVASYWLGMTSGITQMGSTLDNGKAGLFGTACATMGMLCAVLYVLALDTYGPISDNCGGCVELAGLGGDVRACTDRLDAVGNTTKALTKGFAIGSAGLAAFLLFGAFMDTVEGYSHVTDFHIDIEVPEIFVAGLTGAMGVFWFASLCIEAVGKGSQSVIKEVQRQFAEKPGILTFDEEPDYERCVATVTAAALHDMIIPGVMVVGLPIAVGVLLRLIGLVTESQDTTRFLLGAQGIGSFLMISTITGFCVALYLNNAGGAGDNAKKAIEAMPDGPGSEAHKASITADTFGDPLKDTAGPAIHVLIKLLANIAVVLCPIFINPNPSA
eukprot:gnl/Dysnectes_brevis/8466_a15049_215.p1 GENE.gnl/Dysnectes_brevis/8466_a15049_215~~gnl/Dysnectes_brevis/8466_a15049_215.p1  ORF type:complete len:790 (-),score=241.27 gnl/Dysnectes_brevis/8466_a15049_215:124-2451(-)